LANEIFISYRRADAGWAGRIYDCLEKDFQSEGVFMDVRGIQAGQLFDAVIKERADSSKVMLAVIGESWLSEDGAQRLRSPDDYVRKELEIGLRRKERVIPVLIEQGPYLTADKLPETLRDIADLQALRVTHQAFQNDAEQLREVTKDRLERMSSGGKRAWDRTLFLQAAHGTGGSRLEQRLNAILDWAATERHAIKWGNGAKYGTAQIVPKDWSSTAISIDNTGLAFIFMNEFQKMGAFTSVDDRVELAKKLNMIHGVAIPKDKVAQAFVSFQIRNVDQADIAPLLGLIEVELKRTARSYPRDAQ